MLCRPWKADLQWLARTALAGGYAPPATTDFRLFLLSGDQFKGSFTAVGAGFSGDYSRESSSPAYVGAIHHAAEGTAHTASKK